MSPSLSRLVKVAVITLFLGLPLVVAAQESPMPTTPVTEAYGEKQTLSLSQQEKRDFINEFGSLQKEANDMLKQLVAAKGAEELQATLKETVSAVSDCVNKFNQAPAEEQRDIMNDCRNQRLWDNMNEIRGKFVPLQEKQNFLNEFRNLQKEANDMLKQLVAAKGAEESQATLKEVVSAASNCVNKFNQAPADEQRGIMDDCRNQRLWDNMNEIRGKFIPPQEKQNFINEFRNLQKEANQMHKQLTKVKGTEAWLATLKEIVGGVNECINNFNQAPADEQREIMDDCRNQGLWDGLNEIREEFVPPKEIKQALSEIKRQGQELNRFKKQMTKLAGGGAGGLEMIEKLQALLEFHKNSITQAFGRDQREAIQEYRDAQIWDELNKIRAVVELPKEMKNITRDLKIVQKNVKAKSYQQAFKYFGVDIAALQAGLDAKQAIIDQINAFAAEGNIEEAFLLLEEDIHQGWHPGDVRHFSDMMRETYQRMKGLKDTDMKDQIMLILSSIVDTFNQGDYREAKDAFIQFGNQMQKYESLFRRYYKGGVEFDQKTQNALEKLESIIQEKLQKGEVPPEKQVPIETIPSIPVPAPENQQE